MTKEEILAMSEEVVSALWPDAQHLFPSPDLTEPANFVRALEASPVGLSLWRETDGFYVRHRKLSEVIKADTPELALLLALHVLVRRRKEER